MANEGLWRQLLELDGQETARRAKCRYTDAPRRYIVALLNTEYIVNLPEKEVLSVEDCSPAAFGEELCVLVYLINCQDLPVSERLTPAETLPGGQFFLR